MYLDKGDRQKLAGVLSEAKRRYSPASQERLKEDLAIAVGAKQSIGTENPLQVGTDFSFLV